MTRITILEILLLVALLCTGSAPVAAQLIPPGSSWKYLDDGSDQGIQWRSSSFDDSQWAGGPAQLGYGDGDEATVVSFGPDASNKFTTTYFRHTFNVASPSSHPVLNVGLQRDDGAVIYLNGTEVVRENMPAGIITFTTFAASTVSGADEEAWLWFGVDPGLLEPGDNLLAVEIHQRTLTSSDISFDLELNSDPAANLTRGPYLQLGTDTQITLRWRTASGSDSRVRFGDSPTNLTQMVDDASVVVDHEVTLTNLLPETTYYYSIGSTTTTYAGGDPDHFFETAPVPGTEKPVRAWVLGDCGTGNAAADAVRNAYYAFAGADHTNLWLMLGDNAYNSGTETEYQASVYETYPEMLRKSVLWSTRGNHETQSSVYYGMFNFPTAGEAGGLSSGTEAYYSFDHANIHFICLDSEGTNRSTNGAMATWLAADLASTNQRWIIAFWHHPPYTKGSHDSDITADSGGRMRDMRTNLLPILEAGGVDLTLSGHSHSYERSFLIGGHYGQSTTFNPSHVFDGGNGREGSDGAYQKTTAPESGSVYCVAGSSGRISGGSLNHPAMFSSLMVLGSVIIDVDGDRLDVRFLDDNGTIRDFFTLLTQDPIPPQISSVNPAQGQVRGGELVTITGTVFAQNLTVSFGTEDASIQSRSETEIVVLAPPGMTEGLEVDVTVSQPSGVASEINGYTYIPNVPFLTWNGNPTQGGSVIITVFGPANRDVGIVAGTPGLTSRNGIDFCVERPFGFIRRFPQGFNTGPSGQVDIPWIGISGSVFQTWNLAGVIRESPGMLLDLGCTTLTVLP